MEKRMKEKNTKSNIEGVTAFILAALTIITMALQIIISSYRLLSPLETSLFSVLQFLFSLGFAWVLARISFRSEFTKSQKQFAIAAYRRIKEIDIAVERVIVRANSEMKTTDSTTMRELDLIQEIAKGIRQSIKSSVADWSDIIGEEITTVEKIESLNYQEEIITSKIEEIRGHNSEQNKKIIESLELHQKEVKKLIQSLPVSLQLATKKPKNKISSFERATEAFEEEKKKIGYISIEGFWDPTFEHDIYDFKVGDVLTVMQGDVDKRIGAMVAYDKDGKSVGVMINGAFARGLSLSYIEFFDALVLYLGKSKFQVEIQSIVIENQKRKFEDERHYFSVKIL
ncbi:MAG: hypothetical protein AB1458_02340 [Bacteroidota bacterium]